MSAAFPRGRKGWLQVCIPRQHGWVQRSLGTPSAAFAKRVETAMAWLANEKQWDILEAIVAKPVRPRKDQATARRSITRRATAR